jgi:hypothetical protein
MLTAEQKKMIAKAMRIKEEDFDKALTDTAEVKLEIPASLTVLDETELKRVKDDEYNNGKTKGVEIAVKDAKEKLGLEFSGKTVDGLIEAANKKALEDAKVSPDKKVLELQRDIDTLKATNTDLTTKLSTQEKAASSAATEKEIYKNVPSLGENAPEVDIVVTLMRAKGYDFEIKDGKLTALKDGQPVKDNVANVLPVKDVITSFAKEAKLISDQSGAAGGGRGGGDKGGGGAKVYKKMSEMVADAEKEHGKSYTQGAEFNDKVQAYAKANTDFDMNG